MSNALHGYAKLFEKYATNNGGTGVILPGEDCLSLANEMRIDADDIDAENAKLRELVDELYPLADYGAVDASELDMAHDLMRELGVEVDE